MREKFIIGQFYTLHNLKYKTKKRENISKQTTFFLFLCFQKHQKDRLSFLKLFSNRIENYMTMMPLSLSLKHEKRKQYQTKPIY